MTNTKKQMQTCLKHAVTNDVKCLKGETYLT